MGASTRCSARRRCRLTIRDVPFVDTQYSKGADKLSQANIKGSSDISSPPTCIETSNPQDTKRYQINIMPATAPFNPPAADLPGKPLVPAWDAPAITQEKHDFAQLKSIDLSQLDSDDPAVVETLVQKVKVAIRDDGFLFLEDYGVSLEQVSRLNSCSQQN